MQLSVECRTKNIFDMHITSEVIYFVVLLKCGNSWRVGSVRGMLIAHSPGVILIGYKLDYF